MAGRPDFRPRPAADGWVPPGWHEPWPPRPPGRGCHLRRCCAEPCTPLLAAGLAQFAQSVAWVVSCGLALVTAYAHAVGGDYAGQSGRAAGVVVPTLLGLAGAIATMTLGAAMINGSTAARYASIAVQSVLVPAFAVAALAGRTHPTVLAVALLSLTGSLAVLVLCCFPGSGKLRRSGGNW